MSLEKIKERHNIAKDTAEEVKRELIKLIKENHPDTVNLDSAADYDSNYIAQLNEDLEYVEKLIAGRGEQEVLVPVNEVVQTLVEALKTSNQIQVSQTEVLDKRLAESINTQIIATKKKWRVPRISSTSVLGVITFLWMFPNEVLQHPFMQALFDNYPMDEYMMSILTIWLFTLLVTASLWMNSISVERGEKNLIKRMQLESVQNDLFTKFTDRVSYEKDFSKLEFMRFISDSLMYERPRTIMYGRFRYTIQEDVIQNIADIILTRAENNGIIKKIKAQSLVEHYELITE